VVDVTAIERHRGMVDDHQDHHQAAHPVDRRDPLPQSIGGRGAGRELVNRAGHGPGSLDILVSAGLSSAPARDVRSSLPAH
jgi:hypothetical protein